MIKTPAVAVATFIALTAAFSPNVRACDEDCAYEAHEATYERAEERASVREEAAEEGYYSAGRRSSGSSSRREQAAARAAQAQKAAAQSSESRRAEPKPDPAPSTQTRSPRTKVAKENSSISTENGSNRVAEDDSYQRPAKAVGCKKYFASAGMTLSVPCE
jgi:leucyl aminopeptidase (aminopeptidase T)